MIILTTFVNNYVKLVITFINLTCSIKTKYTLVGIILRLKKFAFIYARDLVHLVKQILKNTDTVVSRLRY